MVFKRKKKVHRADIGEHKFCPVCGSKLEVHDTYCTRCGYSFAERGKKKSKKVKWRNVILIIIAVVAAYIAINYFTTGSIIPDFLSGLSNSTAG